jgi:enediyne biosynthesis protein E4
MTQLFSSREAVSFGSRLFCFLCCSAAAADFRVTTLPHRLEYSPTPEKRLIETMTGGVAALDYNNDGFVDLFFTNGAEQPSLRKSSARYWNRLYRNDGGKGFVDVTESAALQGAGFSMGAAAADFDNDGWTDLFVSGVNGASRLYRNVGGTFKPVPLPPVPGWAVGGGWFDFDRDGFLDLFVVKYVLWDPEKERACGDPPVRTYCHPREYLASPNQLFRNQGNGSFSDVSASSRIATYVGKGMSVAFGDLDNDGLPDAFVTNDTVPNFLFRNRGDGKFEEIAVRAGVALNDDGRALSAMGVDFRDIDNDGRDDLFYTALVNETFPFLRNLGGLLFADLTYSSRIGAATLTRSGWGAGIYDFNNDGRKDLFVAGGDVQTNAEEYSSRKSRQPCQLLWNEGALKFRAVDIGEPALHRGAAFADFDNNGTIDVAVSRLGGEPIVFWNSPTEGHHWIGFRVKGLGARISVDGAQHNRATTAVGYASSSDPRVHFGLGATKTIREVVVQWPSGKMQRIANPPVDRYLDIAEPDSATVR